MVMGWSTSFMKKLRIPHGCWEVYKTEVVGKVHAERIRGAKKQY